MGKEMEQWRINRAGVINFWYYDDDEFEFEDGRLLLRGANGSGKSVTMQSLVPLLFDGNKSPERLDPFGSRARKMESYLLSEGLDLEERTGYLFLEFNKPESTRFMTIGMGMKAKKNVPMQSWYFVVKDNRRVGHSYDLSLYKDIGERIPLTMRELENRIGSGGQVFTGQKDYKAAVNDQLFGYTDLTDFDELIELLIQIRSPKLSKEFKPTTMYEIMQNSLVTLTDDDLRPMSEAIENMDQIKTRIEALESARKALGRIDTAYIRYNTHTLVRKAEHFAKAYDIRIALEKRVQEASSKVGEEKQKIQELVEILQGLEAEQQQLGERLDSLQQHDLTRLSGEKVKLEGAIVTQEQELGKAQEHFEGLKRRERQLQDKLRFKKDEQELEQENMKETLGQMETEADEINFDEHRFFSQEYGEAMSAGRVYSFQFVEHQLEGYKNKVKAGRTALKEEEEQAARYDKLTQEVAKAAREKTEQEKIVKDQERLFAELKEEYIEGMFSWNEANRVAKIPREVLTQTAELVYGYGEECQYDRIISPVRNAFDQISNELNKQLAKLESQQEQLDKETALKKEELNQLRQQVEPEPLRSQEVLCNRRRLEGLGIAYIPLYKAIEFATGIQEELKGRLEEAITELGLLDALVIDPKHREQVMKADIGMADKYIFAKPELLSYNLSEYLKPEVQGQGITALLVDDVLKSIFLSPSMETGKVYISESGEYGTGILCGHSSGTSEARFIGVQSRKRYKQQLIDGLLTQLGLLEVKMNELKGQIDLVRERLETGTREFQQFPSMANLAEAFRQLQTAVADLRRREGIEADARVEAENGFEELKLKRVTAHELTSKLSLAHRSEAYEEAMEHLEEYAGLLNRLKLADGRLKSIREMLSELSTQHEQCVDDIEVGAEQVHRLDRTLSGYRIRLSDIQKQLTTSDYQDILSQITECQKRLKQLPSERDQKVNERAEHEAQLRQTGFELQQSMELIVKAEAYEAIYEKGFLQEYSLGYVEVSKEDKLEKGWIEVARRVLRTYGSVLLEKKSWSELLSELQEKFMKESGELAEYNLKRVDLFREPLTQEELIDDPMELMVQLQRMDIVARMMGKEVSFYELIQLIEAQIMENGNLLDDQDRELFEDILIKSVSRKISGKIYHSEQWVKKINELMESMNTSSALNFSLKWVTKRAENEDQLGTRELVEMLKGEQSLLSVEQRERMIKHFRSKIQESKNRAADTTDQRSFLAVMKEILDYRKWFEFELYYIKKGEEKKELTNNRFYTFSGGEKAMAMYVPLFSAVYAKYQGCRLDCPKVVSLDEAFAGVDEKNIEDMFRWLVELKLGFIANSQVLYGDYRTVPALGIYELIRPENVTFVTLLRYKWNGVVRSLVQTQTDGGVA